MKRATRVHTSCSARHCPGANTESLSFACSDQKVHPTENRTLSLAEAFRLHTLDQYSYKWGPAHAAGEHQRRGGLLSDSSWEKHPTTGERDCL